MNILTEVRKALIDRLGTISPDNGYLTNVGTNVKSGWFNEIVKDGDIPEHGLIVVQRAKARVPEVGPAAMKMYPGFSVVAAVRAGLADYEPAIEDIELDLLRCLCPSMAMKPNWLPKRSPNLVVGAPEPFPPGDGLAAATVLVPVHIIAVVDSIDDE